ncbi:MAG: NADP-dependent isocitrate dehydrogenase, partial [Desulfobacterales bacterium]|nr:NADP-dependent isocitrate dehydrogenase [Desulfobacterales bacterium]
MGNGKIIEKQADGSLEVPELPEIPFIEGDGIGPDIWRATRMVIDSAVQKAFDGRRQISWLEVL